MFHRLVLTKCKALFFLFILFIFPFSVNAIVKPTNDFYVNDYAKILTEQTKEYLMKKSITLQENSGIQIVVTTVKNLEGKSIEDYSLEFARSAGIGNKNENNGILILIAYQERNLRIEVGYGLEGIITDGKAGRIRDNYMVPYLKKNDWNNGVKNGYDAIYQEIVKEKNLNLETNNPTIDDNNSHRLNFFGIESGLILGLIFRIYYQSKKKKSKIKFAIYYFLFCFIFYQIFSQIGFKNLAIIIFLSHYLTFLFAFFINIKYISDHYSGGNNSSSSTYGGFSGGGGSFGGGGASGKF